MSTTRSRPPDLDDLDWDEPPSRRPPPRRPRGGGAARKVGLPVVGGALVIGLLVGFLANSGGGGTTTVTETRTVTAPAATSAPAASGAASRADIALAVLNGSDEAGLAGRTADQARSLGYELVTEGNAPTAAVSDSVVFREGAAAKARQVAADLGLPPPTKMTAGDALASVEPGADVIVVLGPTGAAAGADGRDDRARHGRRRRRGRRHRRGGHQHHRHRRRDHGRDRGGHAGPVIDSGSERHGATPRCPDE